MRKLFDIVRDDVWSASKHRATAVHLRLAAGPGRFLFCGGEVDLAALPIGFVHDEPESVPAFAGTTLRRCAYTTTLSRFAARVMPV